MQAATTASNAAVDDAGAEEDRLGVLDARAMEGNCRISRIRQVDTG